MTIGIIVIHLAEGLKDTLQNKRFRMFLSFENIKRFHRFTLEFLFILIRKLKMLSNFEHLHNILLMIWRPIYVIAFITCMYCYTSLSVGLKYCSANSFILIYTLLTRRIDSMACLDNCLATNWIEWTIVFLVRERKLRKGQALCLLNRDSPHSCSKWRETRDFV